MTGGLPSLLFLFLIHHSEEISHAHLCGSVQMHFSFRIYNNNLIFPGEGRKCWKLHSRKGKNGERSGAPGAAPDQSPGRAQPRLSSQAGLICLRELWVGEWGIWVITMDPSHHRCFIVFPQQRIPKALS